MAQSFKIKLGKFLFKNAFPVYNILYPIFKRKQDAMELERINSIIKPGFNVLDIGANIGFYTKVFSELVGSEGFVHAFEPEATNFKYLQGNCGQISNVKLVNLAVSDKTGPIKIYLSKLLNVDHRTYPIDDAEQIFEINATTIDDYLASNNIKRIDFIKMDIQGFEMSALKGMEKTLRNNPEVKIITELWPFGLEKAGSSASEVFDFLHSLGFYLFLFTKTELQPLSQQTLKDLKNLDGSYYNVVVSKENFKHAVL